MGFFELLVSHFKYNAVVTKELKQRETQMEVAQKQLTQDCATRWNSAFYMLERLVEMFSLSCFEGIPSPLIILWYPWVVVNLSHYPELSPPSMGALKWMFTFEVSISPLSC